MQDRVGFRVLQKLYLQSLTTISKQRCPANKLPYTSQYAHQDAGFSLLEIMVVLLIIGVLSAIAAPSWLSFVKRQQLNKANDAVFSALQKAQQEAKKSKRNYSVSFRNNTQNQIEFAIYRSKKEDGKDVSFDDITNNWQPIGGDVGMQFGQLLLGTNLNNENTGSNDLSYSLSTPTKITFDYMGTIPNPDFGIKSDDSSEPPGLRVVVAVPQSAEPTQPSDMKRCVIIQTIIGGMRTAKDSDCNIN